MPTSVLPDDDTPQPPTRSRGRTWTYEAAFCRNLGLIDEADQQRLRKSRVAIAGMGGVGGVHLITLLWVYRHHERYRGRHIRI